MPDNRQILIPAQPRPAILTAARRDAAGTGAASNALSPRPAGLALSALRVVSLVSGQYFYSDPSDAESVFAIAGLITTAATLGQIITPVRDREIQDSSWNWARGQPIFLGSDGTLTQVAPATGWLVVLATPLSANTIFIDIQEPIGL
jgi:hypothetical protein